MKTIELWNVINEIVQLIAAYVCRTCKDACVVPARVCVIYHLCQSLTLCFVYVLDHSKACWGIGKPGYVDGLPNSAKFWMPTGLCLSIDPATNNSKVLLCADAENNRIRLIDLSPGRGGVYGIDICRKRGAAGAAGR